MVDVYVFDAISEVFDGWHIAPWAEGVDLDSHGVNDVVYAMLDYHGVGTRDVHLDGEACGAFEAVGLVGDAIVLAQDARAAYGTAYYGHVVVALVDGAEGEVVGPALRGYGVAVAYQGSVGAEGAYLGGVEEVEPVGFAGEVGGEGVGLGIVAIRVLGVRQRACYQCAGVHLGELGEVDAHVEGVARRDVDGQVVGGDFTPWLYDGFLLVVEREGEFLVVSLDGYYDFREVDGLCACEV